MLIAAEILILGMMVYAVRGGHTVFASGMHSTHFTARPIAPLAAGSAPHVQIDDRDSGVTVTTSSDGLVHVTDQTGSSGWLWGESDIQQLNVDRTSDGVRIARPGVSRNFFNIGFLRQHIDVEVPAGTHLEIVRCSGATITGIENGVEAKSQDGSIHLTDVKGVVNAHSDDGRIVATRLRGDTIALSSNDGRILMSDITTGALDAHTDDGRIEAKHLQLTGSAPKLALHTTDGPLFIDGVFPAAGSYEATTNDGRIELGLAQGSDVTVSAATNDGHIDVDGQRSENDGSTRQSVRVGGGTAAMRVSTNDGSIHITTNGAF